MKKLIKYLYKRIRLAELRERLESYEDCVMHRGNELGEQRIVDDLREEIKKVEGNVFYWLK
jgi:hypothetical protein